LLDGYGLLTVAKGKTIVTTYGLEDDAFARLRERLAG
jgi:hypothetical protein